MTRENVNLKSATAGQAYRPQRGNVVHGRVLAEEVRQPQWRPRAVKTGAPSQPM
jgi:hypothetical protein